MSISGNFPSIRPSLLLDFANVGRLDPRVTFARASTATYFDQLGVLQSAANNVPRFDYDPSTLAPLGLLIEEQRTNSIRNNTMDGAVAGTPGTLPTNWLTQSVGGVALTEVVGTGTENGIAYIDVRYTGTTSSTASGGILTEAITQIPALSGQTWASSLYMRLVGGSTAGLTISNSIFERNSGGTLLAATNTAITPTNAALNTQRVSTTRTLTEATTAFVQQRVTLFPESGVAIDITLRIGLPQLEQGAFATSVIPTTTTALTRSADVPSMTGTNFSSWYNASEGTFYAQYSIQATAGVDRRILVVEGSGGQNVNGIIMFVSNSAQKAASFNNFVSSSNIGRIDSVAAFSANTTYKGAFAITSSDRALSVNGATAVTSTSAFSIPSMTNLAIGQDGAGNANINGHLQRISFYSQRLPNATLQALTA